MSDLPAPLPSPRSTVRTWNVLLAISLLGLSGWTLAADLAHEGHFVLQSSFSTLVLALLVTGWMFASVIFAAFPKRYLFTAVVLVTLLIHRDRSAPRRFRLAGICSFIQSWPSHETRTNPG